MTLPWNLVPFISLASAQTDRIAQAEVPSTRTFFYVGGGYSDDNSGSHIFKKQMYVGMLAHVMPKQKEPNPIVLTHGQGQTEANFFNKPDGGMSWTLDFLEAGYTIYIIDQTFRGRSL
jgi:pimeloyl-ACP methyl ester carboxylesterase